MEDKAEEFREKKRNNTLLLVASARGYLQDVDALIQRGGDVNTRDKKGRAPLHFCSGRGWLEVVKLLWSKAADIDSEDADGTTPLHLAALNGHAEVVNFLLAKGATVMAEDNYENTALHAAARRGNIEVVDILVRRGADVCRVNKYGLTPGAAALASGQLEVVDFLSKTGWKAEDRPFKYSLLHLTAGLGRFSALHWLLSAGLGNATDASNEEKASPLHCALCSADIRCIRSLLDAGADPGAKDIKGFSPLHRIPPDTPPLLTARIQTALGCPTLSGEVTDNNNPVTRQHHQEVPPRPEPTPYETFCALDFPDKLRRVHMWMNKVKDGELRELLRSFPDAEQIMKHIETAAALRSTVESFKAIAALHADEDFQTDMAEAGVRAAVESLTKNPAEYDALVQIDSRVASVVAKMRVVHAVLKAQDRTFALDDVIVPLGELAECRVEDIEKLERMQLKLDQLVRDAVAAAGGGVANEAEANVGNPREEDVEDSLPVQKDTAAGPVRLFIYIAMLVILLAIALMLRHGTPSRHAFETRDDL